MNAKELLKKLVEIRSPSGKESDLAEFIHSYLKKLGYSPVIDEVGNVLLECGSDYWVTAHMDTVEVLSEFRCDGNICYGTGVADDKASIASILLALEKARFNCAFFVEEEETGMGSEYFAERIKPGKAIVMEPTEMRVCTEHWGVFEFQVCIRGESTHASMPEKNAIELALELIEKIRNDKLNLLGIWSKPENLYATPHECILKAEYLIDKIGSSELILKTMELLESYGDVKVIEMADPFSSKEVHRMLERAIVLAGLKVKRGYMPSWTDAVNLHERGWDTVVFGPGNLKNCHTDKEFVDLRDVILASKVLVKLSEICE